MSPACAVLMLDSLQNAYAVFVNVEYERKMNGKKRWRQMAFSIGAFLAVV